MNSLYYQHDPLRVACCPITVHALLHIAPSIRAMGPVWAYWAFPMERHCGDILRNIRSQRFPYASINKYVTSCAQLTHITLLYGLHEQLILLPPVHHDTDVKLPSCKSLVTLINLLPYHSELDPLYVLTPPKGPVETLPAPLRTKLIATLATRFNKSASIIRELIPRNTQFAQYGRARQLEGGDVMHARDFVPLRSDSRDMSFVRVSLPLNYFVHINLLVLQYQLAVDKFAHLPRRAPEFELQDFFGQILRFVIVDIPHSPIHNIEADSFIYAFINQVKISELATNQCGINYYEDLGPTEFVDLNQIRCVVGRIEDRGRWSIIDRSKLLSQAVAECN